MSNTITLEKAAAGLSELVRAMGPDDEIVITENDQVLARILSGAQRTIRVAGTCKGMLTIIKEDDEHLEDFKDYM